MLGVAVAKRLFRVSFPLVRSRYLPDKRAGRAQENADPTQLRTQQAPNRETAVAIVVIGRMHIARIDAEAVHIASIAVSRRPEEAVRALIVRRATAEVARERRRQSVSEARGITTIGCVKGLVFAGVITCRHAPAFRADVFSGITGWGAITSTIAKAVITSTSSAVVVVDADFTGAFTIAGGGLVFISADSHRDTVVVLGATGPWDVVDFSSRISI